VAARDAADFLISLTRLGAFGRFFGAAILGQTLNLRKKPVHTPSTALLAIGREPREVRIRSRKKKLLN
jgi:hypothetical protein